jgi:hypothetical protein
MLALLLSILISAGAVTASLFYQLSTTWAVVFGILAFLGSTLLINLILRRKLRTIQGELEQLMTSARNRMNRKVQQLQQKPGGNPASLQKQMERQQMEVMKKALEHTHKFEPYRKWSPTMGRQINTMRIQYLYHLKRFDEVDELFALKKPTEKPFMIEPSIAGMKMARCYKRDDIQGAEKVFKKSIRWMRGDRGALLYGIMSWILVKQGKTDEAQTLLAKAKDKIDHPTLEKNWESLANDRVKKFSNAGLGEEWYGLYLEAPPKAKQQRVRQGRGQAMF